MDGVTAQAVKNLDIVATEVETTHWCQASYETMTDIFGDLDEVKADAAAHPEWYNVHERGVLRPFNPDTDMDLIEGLYKVQHCLMGMINSVCGIVVSRGSNEGSDVFEDLRTPIGDVRQKMVQYVGREIFGDTWKDDVYRGEIAVDLDNDEGTEVLTSIEGWNDWTNTTKEDILTVVKGARDKLAAA